MTGALILAAGAATRMGRLKQLLPYQGGTLLGHALEQAIGAGFEPIIVVLGADAGAVRISIPNAAPVDFIENTGWQSGMGSSIAAGMRRVRERNLSLSSVAILLGDQPLVESRHLRQMTQLWEGGEAAVVAAEYNGTLGVPAIFRQELFPRLEALPPEAGARHLLRDADLKLLRFSLPEAAVDLDTPKDFAALTSAEQRHD